MKVGEVWRQNGDTREIVLLEALPDDWWLVEMVVIDKNYVRLAKSVTKRNLAEPWETTLEGEYIYENYYKVSE